MGLWGGMPGPLVLLFLRSCTTQLLRADNEYSSINTYKRCGTSHLRKPEDGILDREQNNDVMKTPAFLQDQPCEMRLLTRPESRMVSQNITQDHITHHWNHALWIICNLRQFNHEHMSFSIVDGKTHCAWIAAQNDNVKWERRDKGYIKMWT